MGLSGEKLLPRPPRRRADRRLRAMKTKLVVAGCVLLALLLAFFVWNVTVLSWG